MTSPQSILVVEDEYLIASEMGRMLERAGYLLIGPVPAVADALLELKDNRPDAAILDLQLEFERSTAVADRLVELDVPFCFLSGHVGSELPKHLSDRPLLSKPAEASEILTLLKTLLR